MTIEVFQTASMPQDTLTPATAYLLAKWQTLKATNDLTLQRLTEESSYPIAENSIYMIEADGDFAFMYVGQKFQDQLGFDLTGTLLSARKSAHSADFMNVYRRVVQSSQPAMIRFTSMQNGQCILWQRLILPLKTGNTSILVCFSENITQREAVFEFLFDAAPNALIAIYPSRDEQMKIRDGWILIANMAARTLVRSASPIAGRRLREFSLFDADDVWAAVRRAAVQNQPRGIVRLERFECEIARFQHLLALRIFNVGETLKSAP